MRKWTVRAARALLVGAAFAAVGGGIANADNNTARGDRSLLGGVLADATAPITANNLLRNTTVNANGNAISALSPRSTQATGAAQRLRFINHHHDHGIEATSIGSGDKIHAPLTAPIMICGNAVADNGLGTATCHGHSSISSGSTSSQGTSACPTACSSSTQVKAEPAKPAAPACPTACGAAKPAAPVCPTACDAAQPPAQTTVHEAPPCAQACSQVGAPTCPQACEQSSAQQSSSATHLLSDDKVSVPAMAPITICGNAGAIRGLAAAACDGNASFTRGTNS